MQAKREEGGAGRRQRSNAIADGDTAGRPQRLTRSVSVAASGDRGAAAGSVLPAEASAAAALDTDALSSSSGECVEIKARRHDSKAAAATGAHGNSAAPLANGANMMANGLKRRRSARLNGSQEDVDAAEDDRPSNGQADGLHPDVKRSRTASGSSPPPADTISLHDSGSLPEPSSSQPASQAGAAARADADWSPGSPDAQSPEAVLTAGRRVARTGSGNKRARGALQQRGSGGGSQQLKPGGAIPTTHVACPICGRSVPKVIDHSSHPFTERKLAVVLSVRLPMICLPAAAVQLCLDIRMGI